LTTVEVAERLGLSGAAVAQAVRTGALQPAARTAEDFLFSERAVAAFAERRARAAASPLQAPAASSRTEWTGDVDRLNSWLRDLTDAMPGRRPDQTIALGASASAPEAPPPSAAPPAAAAPTTPPAPAVLADFQRPSPPPTAPPAPVAELGLPPRPVPEPEPPPVVEPEPAPPAKPEREPVPEPEPKPDPQPEPETVPEPNPVVDAAPPAPQPAPEPAPEPAPQRAAQLTPEPAPQPAAQAEPEAAPEPAPVVDAASSTPEPGPEPGPLPAAEPELILAAPIQPAPSSGLSRQAILVIEPINKFRVLREVADRLSAVPGITDARLERLESGLATYRVSFGDTQPNGEAIAGALAPLGLQVMLVDSQ